MGSPRASRPVPGVLLAQEQLLPFLLNPQSYPHRPRSVGLIQTHSSFVLVAPPFVYKVKKPVNFGFLDFSTLEKRRQFCEREVELNRRLCPHTYLGVIPIVRTRDGFAFGTDGTVVEYAVRMRRLRDGCFLDQRIRRGEVRTTDLNRVVRVLRDFYRAQKPTAEIESWGRVERLRISTDENFRQIHEFIGQTVSQPACQALRHFTDGFYSRFRSRLTARVRDGWIRDCHGDLHLDHIHLTRREILIFDCIEFNDRFRYVDVANDAAFLAMDLDFHGRPDLSRRFVDRLASALQDAGLAGMMDFYKCYRAVVRGKVETLHSGAHTVPEAERETCAARARRYFQLALQYATVGSRPQVLVVMGRIGSGKSTLARCLGEALGWPVVSSDALRKEMAGLPLFERSDTAVRARLYSRTMTERTYGRLLQAAVRHVRAGHGVILDATFAQPRQRRRLQRRFATQGIDWRLIEVTASDRTVRQRLRARETRSDEVSDARLEDFETLSRLYQAPHEIAARRRLRVHASGSVEATLTRALQGLVGLHLQHSP